MPSSSRSAFSLCAGRTAREPDVDGRDDRTAEPMRAAGELAGGPKKPRGSQAFSARVSEREHDVWQGELVGLPGGQRGDYLIEG